MEKNKKKVIVPIIIGIALLIALIVGATYAYFQATNNASGTTNLDATTEAIGNVVVQNPTEELYLKLSAYEMHEDQKNNSYYATSTNGSGVVYASERENNVFANYNIEGGTDNATYNCTFKLNVTKPQDIRSGDMNLEISLLNGAKINGGSTLTTDLYNAASSYNVEFSAKGNGTGNLITGDIKLNNTTSIQDHLIGHTLNTSISVSNLECEVAEPKERLAAGVYDISNNLLQTWESLNLGDIGVDLDDPTSNIFTKIDANATKIVIPEGVTKIGEHQFLNAGFSSAKIKIIVLPTTLTSISNNAFVSLYYMEAIAIPNSVLEIGEYAFGDMRMSVFQTIYYSGSATGAPWGAKDVLSNYDPSDDLIATIKPYSEAPAELLP